MSSTPCGCKLECFERNNPDLPSQRECRQAALRNPPPPNAVDPISVDITNAPIRVMLTIDVRGWMARHYVVPEPGQSRRAAVIADVRRAVLLELRGWATGTTDVLEVHAR